MEFVRCHHCGSLDISGMLPQLPWYFGKHAWNVTEDAMIHRGISSCRKASLSINSFTESVFRENLLFVHEIQNVKMEYTRLAESFPNA